MSINIRKHKRVPKYTFTAHNDRLKHVLQPENSIKDMKELGDILTDIAVPTKRVLTFHGFSMAAFMYGNLLMHTVGPEKEKYAAIADLVKAQAFDSPVDMEGIADGLSTSLEMPKPIETLARVSIEKYLFYTKDTAGKNYKASQQTFYYGIPKAPISLLYSETDKVACHKRIQYVSSLWSSNGHDVSEIGFEETPHVQHHRYQKERYETALVHLLARANIL